MRYVVNITFFLRCEGASLFAGFRSPSCLHSVVFKWGPCSSIFYLSGATYPAGLKIFTSPEEVHRVPRTVVLNSSLFMSGTTTTDSHLFAEKGKNEWKR